LVGIARRTTRKSAKVGGMNCALAAL
jgi:hypothetical protein